MLSYCLKCRKNTESKSPDVKKTKKGRLYYFLGVWCVAIKNSNSSKSKNPLDC